MDEERTPHKTHFHIHWQAAARLDWEAFDSPEEAGDRAMELAKPGELFMIEEFDGDCPQCGAQITQALRRLRQ